MSVIERMDTACKLDLYKFPADTQRCRILLQSESFPSQQLSLTCDGPSGIILDSYEANGEWELLNASCYHTTVENQYSAVVFELTLRRRIASYILRFTLPFVVLSLMSSVVFLIPQGSGEKLTLSCAILLSFTVFLLMVVRQIPTASGSVPLYCEWIYSSKCRNNSAYCGVFRMCQLV